MMETMSHEPLSRDLGAYLRARRERTSPRDVGLPDSGRRRTPGLRREEVATLAGVSVDYLVRLEQGRDLHPSAEVLAALADAMRLRDDERAHLFHLGVRSGNEALCPTPRPMSTDVAPNVVRLLEALDPMPAFVLAPNADLVGWNRAWAAFATGLGMFDGDGRDGGRRPNLARYVFGHPDARRTFPQWRVAADEQVGRLRRAMTFWSADEAFCAVVDDLRGVPEFAIRWDAHPVAEQRRGTTVLTHPDVGDVTIDFEVLELPDDTGQQLVSWLPADAATTSAFAALEESPPLRLVTG